MGRQAARVTVSDGVRMHGPLWEADRDVLLQDWRRGLAQLVCTAYRAAPAVDGGTRPDAGSDAVLSEEFGRRLAEVLRSGGHIVVDREARVVEVRGHGGGGPSRAVELEAVFHCHFDADFARWSWHWGGQRDRRTH